MDATTDNWLRVTVETDSAQEEFVSELLNDAAGGRGIEVLDRRAALLAPEAASLAPGRILVRAYVPLDEYRGDRFDVSGIPGSILHPPTKLDDSWRTNWKRFFKASRVGRRFVVRPPWDDLTDRNPGDIDIVIDPGMAFGTGTHETTRLCLQQFDIIDLEGARVLDVGCGSGVLAVAAVKVGASSVVAIDIDQAAIDATDENAERNHVAGIEASVTPIHALTGTWDVVVANILASVLVALREELFRCVRPGGTLLLSGILADEAEDVADAFTGLGLVARSVVTDREWVAIRLERAP